ncbi:MAG: C10 family peptidase [Prevotella sp.]|nr:C10 family peptidase [Prevotella sp.]
MKKLLLTLFVLAIPLLVLAESIEKEKAMQIACQFMANIQTGKTNGKRAASTPQLQIKDIGMKNLYAFADDVDGTYVIVAGDDCVEPVLAYGKTDAFNLYTMPKPIQMMLLGYEQQIGKMRSGKTIRRAPEASNREVIAPLVQTMWHQYLPFNYECPYDEVSQMNTYVGCVALTLAQLMYYYQYPQSTTVEIPAYTTAGGYELPALPPTTFDYSKMHLNYDYIYYGDRNTIDPTDPSIEEVTKLLLYAGCAVKMEYSTRGSAAVFDNELIAKYFGYDKGARYLMAGNYPHDVWEEMVYNELKAGRPVPYSAGAVGNQSHQFIIDGYDGNGFFHTNLGEIGRGSSDTFFRLGVLNDCWNQKGPVEFSGYNVYQAAHFGFQPDKGNDAVPIVSVDYGNYELLKTDFTRSSSNANFKDIVLSATMKRFDNNGHTMDYGWGLFQNGLLKKELCSSTTDQETTNLNMKFNMGKGLTDGTYQIFPIFRNNGAQDWEEYLEYLYTTEDGTPMRHYTATINNNKLHIDVSSTEPNLNIDKVEYYAAYVGEKLNMRVWLTNNGTNYENELFLWIDEEENMRTGVGAYVDPGKSDYIDFCTAAPTKGTHKVKITTDWEGKKVIYTGKLTVSNAPKCLLEANVTTNGMDENNIVHDKLDIVCKITNTGDTDFYNLIEAGTKADKIDNNGNSIYDEPNGYPTWNWVRVWYIHLKPGESTEISFTIGKEVFKPYDYEYCLYIDYDNNHEGNTERIYNWAFRYLDASGIEGPATKNTADDGIYYDLQGRRINSNTLTRGVYIHNNKKILVR